MTTKMQKTKTLTTKNIKKQYNKIHDNVIDVAEESVEGAVKNIEKWQKLVGKAIKQSTPIVEKNIDLTFDVVESLAKQYKTGGKRMKSLLGIGGKVYQKNMPSKKVANVVEASKSAVKTVVKDVKASVKTAVKSATKTTKPAVKAVKTATKATVKSSPVVKSSLTTVNGIGPKIEQLLNAEKIFTLSELANADIVMLNKVLDAAGPKFQMHDPSTWVNQAKSLIKA